MRRSITVIRPDKYVLNDYYPIFYVVMWYTAGSATGVCLRIIHSLFVFSACFIFCKYGEYERRYWLHLSKYCIHWHWLHWLSGYASPGNFCYKLCGYSLLINNTNWNAYLRFYLHYHFADQVMTWISRKRLIFASFWLQSFFEFNECWTSDWCII